MNLNKEQIQKVIDWMNTWEQLKDTAIPLRFKEEFTKKLTLTDVGNTLNGRKYIDLEKVNKSLNDINLKSKDAYLETEKGKCKLVVELESIIK